MKKRYAVFILVLAVIVLLAACLGPQQEAQTVHKIGVPVYNTADAEVRMFRDYLENYIGGCFEDVSFLYSGSITSEEELMEFLSVCADEGVEGILSFISYDLKAELGFCSKNHMYFIRAAGTTSGEQLALIDKDPWYLGEIGPGAALESQAGEEMTRALAHKGDGQRYLILSGGGYMGNEMHRLRTVAMLETLEEIYGVSFDQSPEDLALLDETANLTAGELQITVCPGYVSREPYTGIASDVIVNGDYDVILSCMAVTPLMDALKAVDIRCGVVDCFSEDNYFGFQKGKIAYVAGKYQSEVGPAFAALYNAITGGSDLYREDGGKAFRLEQGFWSAADEASYNKMYGLSSGISINAYDYEDLYSAVRALNPDASFDQFKALVGAYRYEECLARRGGE